MQAEDSGPELRVIGEEPAETAEVPRLVGDRVEEVLRLGAGQVPVKKEEAMRLAAAERKAFEARSVEPVVEEILNLPALEDGAVELERRWGEGATKRPVPWGYLALFAVLCVAAAVWSLRQLVRNKDVRQAVVAEAVDLELKERAEEEAAMDLLSAIEMRVAQYLAAKDPQEMLEHVRRRDKVEPLVRDWYARHPYASRPLERMGTLHPVTLDGKSFWVAMAETAGGRHSLLVEEKADGRVWVDWETDVCYQPVAWDEFVAKRPQGLYDFRVSAAEDTFYAHEFKSTEQFLCLRLTAKESEDFLFGYVRRGGEDEAKVREALAAVPNGQASLLLKLGFLPGSPAMRSVSVVSVVATRWCVVED